MSKIADKISKLLAIADSTVHKEEADAFMAKAHALLEEHGLSLLDLGKLNSEDPVGNSGNIYTSSDPWKDQVAFKLACYYGCEMITRRSGKTTRGFYVIGRESARITFQLMLPFVLRQVAALALSELAKGHYRTAARARTSIANALAIRLWKLTEANEKARPASHGSGINALVPVDLIEHLIKQDFPVVKPSKARYDHDYNAVEVANKVSLNQQTPARADALKLTDQGYDDE